MENSKISGEHPSNTELAAAKVNPPWPAWSYARKRLFERLDAARRYPVIWIAGPAGAGKTTLAASYLEARNLTAAWYRIDKSDADIAGFFYYLALASNRIAADGFPPLPIYSAQYDLGTATFSRNFFDKLFARIPRPGLVILDNFQEIAANTNIQTVIRAGLETIPTGCYVLIISREMPPPVLTRLRANRLMDIVGWRELRLARKEIEGIVREHAGPDAERLLGVDTWLQRVQGWAAGLTLLLEWFKGEEGQSLDLAQLADRAVFDYFADELLAKIKSETRHFLLCSAILQQMTEEQARRLTGNECAGVILAELTRRNFFITHHVGSPDLYRYHPLFRDHLLAQARATLPCQELKELMVTAVDLLEEDAQTSSAIELLQELQDWPRMMKLIERDARQMLAQGRYRTLVAWIDAVPEALRQANPWLMYWLGNSLMVLNIARSLDCFEQAFEQFHETDDACGLCLAWSGALAAVRFDWSGSQHRYASWLQAIDEVSAALDEFRQTPIELEVTTRAVNALAWYDPLNPQCEAWQQRLLTLIDHDIGDLNRRADGMAENLLAATLFRDRLDADHAFVKLDWLLRRGEPEVTVCTGVLAWIGLYMLAIGNFDECRKSAQNGLAIADGNGVYFYRCFLMLVDGAAALLMGVTQECTEVVNRMAELPEVREGIGKHVYHQLAASESIAREDWIRAHSHTQASVAAAQQTDGVFYESWALARHATACFKSGRYDESDVAIAEALDKAYSLNAPLLIWGCLLEKAYVALQGVDEVRALAILQEAFALGRVHGYMATPGVCRYVLQALCEHALKADIEVEYTRMLIQTFRFEPDPPPLHIARWPWPLRIYTLGRYDIQRNEQSLQYGRKTPKQSLQLIKVLVACGGRNVPTSTITDALWPELEGDKAQGALKTAVSRLRRLVGADTLLVTDGRISINPNRCWLDTWAFNYWAKQAKAASPGTSKLDALEHALRVYAGHFLDDETDKPWSHSLRNRLHTTHTRLVSELALARESDAAWDQALQCWQHGLEVDDLTEAYYRGAMRCYAQLDLKAEALNTYGRCRRQLAIRLATEPAAKTQQLYREIQSC